MVWGSAPAEKKRQCAIFTLKYGIGYTLLFNRSMSEGCFPAVFKEAFITPIVKKAGLDATDVSSYLSLIHI